MRPASVHGPVAFALFLAGCALAGCVLTLPFDELTGGGPRPTSYYPLDETAGATVPDVVGPNPGVLEADGDELPAWTTAGKRGGAVDFPDDGWIEVPNLSEAKFPARGTIAFWVKLRARAGSDVTALFLAIEPDDVAPLGVYVAPGGVYFEREGRGGDKRESHSEGAPLDTWLLVAAGWDVDADETVLLVRPEGRAPFPIQRGGFPSGFALEAPTVILSAAMGTLDEVRYYDRLLTDEELKVLD
ncbi:MAG: hypothetical protein KIS78_05410 [Labilithrix sp.]|nr:hypothetical protein [Labilithrix sp.]